MLWQLILEDVIKLQLGIINKNKNRISLSEQEETLIKTKEDSEATLPLSTYDTYYSDVEKIARRIQSLVKVDRNQQLRTVILLFSGAILSNLDRIIAFIISIMT